MRNLIRTTLRAVARRLQRWQQARTFRREWHYHAARISEHRVDPRSGHISRHTWE
jgi:hypothetical protein